MAALCRSPCSYCYCCPEASLPTLLFLVAFQAVPLSQQLPRSCILSLAGLILSSLSTVRETSLLPHGRKEGKRELKKV